MENRGEETYHSQGIRMVQGSAIGDCIVPAVSSSSSCNGLSAGLTTGPAPENAPVEEKQQEVLATDFLEAVLEESSQGGDIGVPSAARPETERKELETERKEAEIEIEDSDSMMSITSNNEETKKAVKRKKVRSPIEESGNESEESCNKIRIKLRNRRRIREIDVQEEIVDITKKDESNVDEQVYPLSNKEEEEARRKVGRPKKKYKAIDPELAEQEIMNKAGKAPEHLDHDLLKVMTASDISAQALDYLGHIELIRKKSGRLQGGLSGELKKRTQCLEEIIRTLQKKADAKGDPEYLRNKIDDLLVEIRRNKTEEKRRKREMQKLQEIIKDLKEKNKNIREEMRRIRESISMERTKEVTGNLPGKSPGRTHDRRDIPEKRRSPVRRNALNRRNLPEEGSPTMSRDVPRRFAMSHEVPRSPMEPQDDEWPRDGMEWSESGLEPETEEKKEIKEESVVWRPILGGKRVPIPNTRMSKEERLEIIKRQRKAQKEERLRTGKPIIKKIEEIDKKIKIITKEEKEKENKEEDIERKDIGRKEILWTEVVKKGRRKKPEQQEDRKEEKKIGKIRNRSEEREKVKRRIPKSSAIAIKGSTKEFSYADALKKARTEISLENLGIDTPRIRKGMNGATIIEIYGNDNCSKADQLAEKIQRVLHKEALVTRPTI